MKKITQIVFLIGFSLSYLAGFSQSVPNTDVQLVKVIDIQKSPVIGAIISYTMDNDSTKRKYAVTDTSGTAKVFVIQKVKYYFIVTSIGYEKAEYFLKEPLDEVVIILKEDTQLLSGVTVFGKKPLIEQDGEKMIVDAQQLVKFSVNLYDIVKRTPTVVAVNDGIYLGSSPATIYINGVEQRMNSAEIVALLKNMPASMVEKIEVIHVASAKYDAASTGRIINIILKKGVKIGLNGSSSVGFTQGRYNDKQMSSSLYYNNN